MEQTIICNTVDLVTVSLQRIEYQSLTLPSGFSYSSSIGWISWIIFNGIVKEFEAPWQWQIQYHVPQDYIYYYLWSDQNIANSGVVSREAPFLKPMYRLSWLQQRLYRQARDDCDGNHGVVLDWKLRKIFTLAYKNIRLPKVVYNFRHQLV